MLHHSVQFDTFSQQFGGGRAAHTDNALADLTTNGTTINVSPCATENGERRLHVVWFIEWMRSNEQRHL